MGIIMTYIYVQQVTLKNWYNRIMCVSLYLCVYTYVVQYYSVALNVLLVSLVLSFHCLYPPLQYHRRSEH